MKMKILYAALIITLIPFFSFSLPLPAQTFTIDTSTALVNHELRMEPELVSQGCNRDGNDSTDGENHCRNPIRYSYLCDESALCFGAVGPHPTDLNGFNR